MSFYEALGAIVAHAYVVSNIQSYFAIRTDTPQKVKSALNRLYETYRPQDIDNIDQTEASVVLMEKFFQTKLFNRQNLAYKTYFGLGHLLGSIGVRKQFLNSEVYKKYLDIQEQEKDFPNLYDSLEINTDIEQRPTYQEFHRLYSTVPQYLDPSKIVSQPFHMRIRDSDYFVTRVQQATTHTYTSDK